MVETYYLFEDKSSSFATLIKTTPENKEGWLEELCDSADVLDGLDDGNYRDYILSYRGKKGGARIRVGHSGIIILSAMTDWLVKPITESEAMEYRRTREVCQQTPKLA